MAPENFTEDYCTSKLMADNDIIVCAVGAWYAPMFMHNVGEMTYNVRIQLIFILL
jgi:hypothetical protein